MGTASKSISADVTQSKALEHLEEVLSSKSFAASPRCRQFLRFVVERTLDGQGDSIKERTIALEVFGKGVQFEPGEDSLVRVKAREVRRRLAEYYLVQPDSPLRIDLPLGRYVPSIQTVVAEPIQPTPSELAPAVPEPELDVPIMTPTKKLSRRVLIFSGLAAGGAIVAYPLMRYTRVPPSCLDLLWRPVFDTKNAVLVSIPLLTAEDGSVTDRVGMGAATAANEAAEFFLKAHYPYRLRFGSDLTFQQLREQPSLLLGGFSSAWTQRVTTGLRYSLILNEDGLPGGSIEDSQTGLVHGPIYTKNGYATEDYALVCRLFDEAAGQIMLVAAGITTFGTESSARFFFRTELFSQIVRRLGPGWQHKNFQAVIHLGVIGTTPSSPKLIGTHSW